MNMRDTDGTELKCFCYSTSRLAEADREEGSDLCQVLNIATMF